MNLNGLNTFPQTSRLAFDEITECHTLAKPSQTQFRVRSSRERQLTPVLLWSSEMRMGLCPKLLSDLAECLCLVGKVDQLPLPLISAV